MHQVVFVLAGKARKVRRNAVAVGAMAGRAGLGKFGAALGILCHRRRGEQRAAQPGGERQAHAARAQQAEG